MTNDRVIQGLQELSARFSDSMSSKEFETIDQAIEALHRADISHSAAEPGCDLSKTHDLVAQGTYAPKAEPAVARFKLHGELLPGLSFDPATGRISGVPEASGEMRISVEPIL